MKIAKLLTAALSCLLALPGLIAHVENKPTHITVSCKLYNNIPATSNERYTLTTASQKDRVENIKKDLIIRGREAIRTYKAYKTNVLRKEYKRLGNTEPHFHDLITEIEEILAQQDAGTPPASQPLNKKRTHIPDAIDWDYFLIGDLKRNLKEINEAVVAYWEALYGPLDVMRQELKTVARDYWLAMLQEMKS